VRANALGALQANVGLWRFWRGSSNSGCGHESVVAGNGSSFHRSILCGQLFDAAHSSLRAMLTRGGEGNLSRIRLWSCWPARAARRYGARVHEQIADRIRSVLARSAAGVAGTLFTLYDGMDGLAHGSARRIAASTAGSLKEFEMPRAIFTRARRQLGAGDLIPAGIRNCRCAPI